MSTRAIWILVAIACASTGLLLKIAREVLEPADPGSLDNRVLDVVVRYRAPVVPIARGFSHLGDPLVVVILAVLAGLVLWRTSHDVLFAAVPAMALAAGALIEVTTKHVVGRERPPVLVRLVHEADPSFPSGHTTGAAALYVAIALVAVASATSRRTRITVPLLGALLAGLVGAARVVLGVHWLSDVAAGWCLGVACAIGCVLAAEALTRRRLACS